MVNKEMITVRMNRADVNTPWGFQVRPPGIVHKIDGGGLADRAGIQHDDEISEIQGERVNDFNRLQGTINQPIHEIELIIYRNMSSTRIWKPSISESSEPSYFQKSTTNTQSNVKVNLEHKPMNSDPLVNGFNSSAKPFESSLHGNHANVEGNQRHIETSATHSTKAEQYLKQTGGLFGTDPNAKNAFATKNNQPSYLNSETLKLIQEDDKREKRDKTPVAMNNNSYRQESCGPQGIMNASNVNPNLPVCFICGRNILGLVCRAFDVSVHADCFSCSTCGSNLKNQGHHFLNSKFYCDVHGRQVKSLSQPRHSPNISKISYQQESKTINTHSVGNNIYQHDLSKPSYQTDIMGRHPILSEKQNEEEVKNYSSSTYTTVTNESKKTPIPYYGSPHVNSNDVLNVHVNNVGIEAPQSRNLKKSPLPKDIRNATVKFLKKSDNLPNWPPSESSATSSQKYWTLHLGPYEKKENKSLLDLVAEEDSKCSMQNNNIYVGLHSPALSSTYERSYDSNISSNQRYIEAILIPSPNIDRLTPPRISPRKSKKRELQKKEIDSKCSFVPIKPDMDDEVSNQLANLPEILTTSSSNDITDNITKIEKHLRWVEAPEIIEETDILTEESFSDYRLNENENTFEDIEADESDCVDEQEQWIKEELEEYRREKELEQISMNNENSGLFYSNENVSKNGHGNEDTVNSFSYNPCEEFEEGKLTHLIESTQKLLKQIEEKHGIERSIKINNNIPSLDEKNEQDEEYAKNDINEDSTKKLIEETRVEVEKMKAELRERSIIISNEEYQPVVSNCIISHHITNFQNENLPSSQQEPTKFITPGDNICNIIKKAQVEDEVSNDDMSMSNKCLDYHQQQRFLGGNYSGNNDITRQQYTNQRNIVSGKNDQQSYENRIPVCNQCRNEIHGAFVMTGGDTYCPEHFVCANVSCSRKLVNIGFVEEKGQRFCEVCFEKLIAPVCGKCSKPITGDCLNALQKQFHPHCFTCAHCMRPFGNAAFYMENGKPYCERDWNNLFTTKCVSCKFPIEAGDRWVEALGSSFHSNCFCCVVCHVNLEGQSFYAKNNQPYCRIHA
uniref:PDZ and LIM domain protein Zasp n=1 Tax=Strongyloides papillosus TaxID=174720 RepID=A0A0N5C5N7_STREA